MARARAGLFGRDDDGARSAKGVEDQIASLGNVPDRIGDQCHGLDRRVHGDFSRAAGAENIHARIVPDRSVTLLNRARNKSPGSSGSRRNDDFTPRLQGPMP
jgi:hypothetical protein